MTARRSTWAAAAGPLLAVLVTHGACRAAVPAPASGANALQGSFSPYLTMHAGDPVHWQPWGPAALAQARAEHKLLFITSGYFACRWCHVMQQESFRDPAVAALLNAHFIPVAVDRQLEPALDAYLVGFVEATRGNAGWPLNVFITPRGYPLLGLTYTDRHTFHRLLVRLSSAWMGDADKLSELARRADAQRAHVPPKASEPPADPAPLLAALEKRALNLGDEIEGGFGRQGRFPMAPQLMALLVVQAHRPQQPLADFLRLTLDRMAGQGLHDLLAGGFFRYTVDPDWQTPHFEKMLYDQALLIRLYLRAAEVLHRPAYRTVARGTLDFVLRDMAGADGALIASLSALDDRGVEGGAYRWTGAQLDALLEGSERKLAGLVWGLGGDAGSGEGKLPVQRLTPARAAKQLGLPLDRVTTLLARARAKLLLARGARHVPRNDTPLAAWNGLMLSALAAGVQAFGDDYRAPGGALRDFLVQRLWDGHDLHRSRGPNGWLGEASLEDYAAVARGLMDWTAVDPSAADRGLALTLVRRAWTLFFNHGWQLGQHPLLPGLPPEAALPDSPLPSPSATVIRITRELADPKRDKDLLAKVHQALALGYGVASEAPFGYAGTVLALAER